MNTTYKIKNIDANDTSSIVFPSLTKSIVLVGLMGTGKTHIGRALAEYFSIPFVDTDQVIEEKAGMSIPSIFDLYGEDKFRDIEKREIQRILEEGVQIIATGGGAFNEPQSRARILEKALSIWLKAKPSTLAKRLVKSDNRPLLAGKDTLQVLTKLADERSSYYAQAHLTVEVDRMTFNATIQNVKNAIYTHLNNQP